jgi:hypothetical protein
MTLLIDAGIQELKGFGHLPSSAAPCEAKVTLLV